MMLASDAFDYQVEISPADGAMKETLSHSFDKNLRHLFWALQAKRHEFADILAPKASDGWP